MHKKMEFRPVFQYRFLQPKYWGTWLALGACCGIALMPVTLRDPLLGALGRTVGKFARRARRRARINLYYCMPELTETQREDIIDQMFAVAPQSMAVVAELALRQPEKLRKRVVWHGREIIDELRASKQNVIFLVPHGWAIDIAAMLITAEGVQGVGLIQHQRNQLVDYIWNKVRCCYGARVFSRNNGIKPFIDSVRNGSWGYYLPDEDHGAEQSEFVGFFGTYKATLPAAARLMKVCRARVVPLFPTYDSKRHQVHMHIRPPMDDLQNADAVTQARRMNEEIENLVRPHPEQYTWILKVLKTRKPGEAEPYLREDLYPE
ncbi:lauroyl-KDO2-lipid IV(A) myristoyltransferase [Erwinia toletana]|uniref:Lipid A biosynthesis acyltransferase n=2 Tax=Winslowiella toletana TaxID=92490 RepID=A0ABS4P313_9GAMM|nr:lauroyl-KDO2-lipid IV(A) myristoyltransferase [Winslowiella toletana]